MNSTVFFEQLEATIARYDLLCHPFYRAWAAGELTRKDLREYARHYYHHVEAFPCYLAELALRLDEGELRRPCWPTCATREELLADAARIPFPTPNFGSTLRKAWVRDATCGGISRWTKFAT